MAGRIGRGILTASVLMMLTLGLAGPARAAFITNGCAAVNQFCTLKELQDPFAFINIDGVAFNNFSSLFFDPALIKVAPSSSGVGLEFRPFDVANNNPWFAEDPPSDPAEFTGFFSYDVTNLSHPGHGIGYAYLTAGFLLDVSGGAFDTLSAVEEVSPRDFANIYRLDVDCADFSDIFCTEFPFLGDFSFVFPSQALTVENTVNGRASRFSGAGNVELGLFFLENRFNFIPAPATLSLLGLGLAGLGWSRRKKA